MNEDIISRLVEHRRMLLNYVKKKISDKETAEDVLQESLLKALLAAGSLKDNEKLIPWFLRILNNAIADIYRSAKKRPIPVDKEIDDLPMETGAEDKALICECFRSLLPTLKPEYAELIEKLELTGGDPQALSLKLGISRNNLKVRRHRARRALRRRLEETCRLCAKHGCLDCTCRDDRRTRSGITT